MEKTPSPRRRQAQAQGWVAAFTEDERYRLTGELYARVQQCIRCYCLGEICDAHPPPVVPLHTGPFAPVEHWTQKALRWSMTWLLVFVGISALFLTGGSDMKW